MKRILSLAVAGLVLFSGVSWAGGPSASLRPADGLSAKDEVRVQVDLSDMSRVKGYGFTVSFDPTQYEFVKAEQGSDNLFGSASPLFLTSSKDPGEVMIANAALTSQNGISGNGGAAVLIFRKLGNVTGSFRLTNLLVLDAAGGVNPILDVQPLDLKPKSFGLDQNYPNPFNPATQIAYRLPEDSHVRLSIFNILGQQVRTLVNGRVAAGAYSVAWDGKDQVGRQAASGIYLYRLEAGQFSAIKRMTLLK